MWEKEREKVVKDYQQKQVKKRFAFYNDRFFWLSWFFSSYFDKLFGLGYSNKVGSHMPLYLSTWFSNDVYNLGGWLVNRLSTIVSDLP